MLWGQLCHVDGRLQPREVALCVGAWELPMPMGSLGLGRGANEQSAIVENTRDSVFLMKHIQCSPPQQTSPPSL